MNLKIKAAALTHAGKVRANNEDNFYLNGHIRKNPAQKEAASGFSGRSHKFLAAVADGMGGQEYGEVASLLAVKALRPCALQQVKQYAQACIEQANNQICIEIEKNGGRRMGSTLTALYIDKERAICCNIGDSRCYLFRDGKLHQLSTDHNKAGRLVELGVLTPEQAARHPSRHELTQHLGIYPAEMVIQPAFSEPLELKPGDRLLLCSDGLTDMISQEEIAMVLNRDDAPEAISRELVNRALENGGRDNVTVLVMRVQEASGLGFCQLWNRKEKQE
ncbi:MAG: PP2C family protein-serine/threonine phosphatase [Candidatus Merdivicinus sp.]